MDESSTDEHHPFEFLHAIETQGLLPHALYLRRDGVLKVLRNHVPHLAVYNGTWVVLEKIGTRILDVIILNEPKRGERIKLCQIRYDSTPNGDLPAGSSFQRILRGP